MATANPQIEVKVKTMKSGHEAPANTRTKMQSIMPFSAAWSRPRPGKLSSQVSFDQITHSKVTSMGKQEHSGSLDLILLRQRYARMMTRSTMMMMLMMVALTKTMRMVMKCHLLAKALDPSPQRGASSQQTRPLKKTPRET